MFILHSGMEWMAAGIVGFVGMMLVIWRITRGDFGHAIASIALWFIMLSIHGNGTAVGAMTATMIMVLFDIFGWPMIALFRRMSR